MATTRILETDITNLHQDIAVAVSIHRREKLEELVSALLDSETSVVVLCDKRRTVMVEIVLRCNEFKRPKDGTSPSFTRPQHERPVPENNRCGNCGVTLETTTDHFFPCPACGIQEPYGREPPTQKDKDTAIQPSFPRGQSRLFKEVQ